MIVDQEYITSLRIFGYSDLTSYLGWTYVSFPMELAYLADSNGTYLISWMNQTFNSTDWVFMVKTMFFRNEKDAACFILKWV